MYRVRIADKSKNERIVREKILKKYFGDKSRNKGPKVLEKKEK